MVRIIFRRIYKWSRDIDRNIICPYTNNKEISFVGYNQKIE